VTTYPDKLARLQELHSQRQKITEEIDTLKKELVDSVIAASNGGRKRKRKEKANGPV
jgi:chaperonin cofactor prefoldin